MFVSCPPAIRDLRRLHLVHARNPVLERIRRSTPEVGDENANQSFNVQEAEEIILTVRKHDRNVEEKEKTVSLPCSSSSRLIMYEHERQNRVQANIQKRMIAVEERLAESNKEAQLELQERIRVTKLKQETFQQTEQALEAYARQRKLEIEALHNKQTERFTAVLRKAAEAAASEELKKEQRAAELQLFKQHEANCRAIETLLKQISGLKEQVLNVFRTCNNQKGLAVLVTPQIQRLKVQEATLESIRQDAQSRETSSLALATAKEALETSQQILSEIQHAKEKLDQETREAQRTQELNQVNQQPQVQEPKTPTEADKQHQKGPEISERTAKSENTTNTTEKDKELAEFVHPMMYERYTKMQKFLKDYEESCVSLEKDTSLKHFTFKCKKASITPVNTIAEHSASHLRDILDRLRNLLNGQSILVDGKPFSPSQHPQGLAYCMKTMARKFVSQGENAVSSKNSPYPIAAVMVALAAEFSTFGQLLEAYFYKCCPYTVPYYVPNVEGQSSEDYLKSLGYICEDNELENETQYFNRMSGMVRLFAAMCFAPLPSALRHRGVQHPFGIAKLWTWFAMILNFEPRPGITALIINDVLVVGGHTLYQTYGTQFHKLLHVLCTDYFVKIKQTNPKGSGHVGVLQVFLEKTLKEGEISAPAKLLPANFW
nr:EOG090X0755 [Triops cancriformis]